MDCAIKAFQDIHPLFCRGFDTELRLRVLEDGLIVTVDAKGGESIVMDHPIYKVC